MELKWIQAEQRLWDAVTNPERRRPTLHSIPKAQTKRRKKIKDRIEKERAREFAAEWESLHALLLHLPPRS